VNFYIHNYNFKATLKTDKIYVLTQSHTTAHMNSNTLLSTMSHILWFGYQFIFFGVVLTQIIKNSDASNVLHGIDYN